MYEKGQAFQKANERYEKFKDDQNGNFDHNKIDLFKVASEYSTHKEILAKCKDHVIYKIWASELFEAGRAIEKELEKIYDAVRNVELRFWSFWKDKELKNNLETIVNFSKVIRVFEEDVYEYQNCVTTTGIHDVISFLFSVSQFVSAIKQKENRVYELIAMKTNNVENIRISMFALFVAVISTVISIKDFC